MILVDTSVWIDHLHRAEAGLSDLLARDLVLIHEGVLQEIALGSLRERDTVLSLLSSLRRSPVLRPGEFHELVERERLWGRGLSAIDVQLLGAARLTGAMLWTRDKRLRTAAGALGVGAFAQT